MKKLFNIVICIALMAVMVSCGGSGYSEAKCEKLAEKIKNHGTLSDPDYSEMLDQILAGGKVLESNLQEYKNDPEKLKEYKESPEFIQTATYVLAFSMYIAENQDQLSPSLKEKMDKVDKEMQQLDLSH